MRPSTLVASVASLFTLAEAHGIVHLINAGGKSFKSPAILSNQDPSPFFLVADNGPVHDVNSKDIMCGRVASKPRKSATVSAGTTLTYEWSGGYSIQEGSSWIHDIGPMSFYMTKCSGNCADIGPSAKWTKMSQFGMEGGKWKQAELQSGKGLSFTIPANLEAGDYVIRHEIINLAINQAEMFPQCQWFTVTGGGSVDISAGDQVTFPGAYSSSDRGLTVSGAPAYEIHSNSAYTFPGPSVFKASSSSGNSPSQDSESESSSTKEENDAPAPTTPVANVGDSNDNTETNGDTTSSPDPSNLPHGNLASGEEDADEECEEEATTNAAEPSVSVEDVASPVPTLSNSSFAAGSLSCADAWSACNAKYTGDADNQQNYACHTQYNECVAAELAASNAKRMHRRRRAFFMASH